MPVKLNVIGLVVSDMATSLAFYRRLGLDVPSEADSAEHVEVELGGDLKLAFDTDATFASFDPGHRPVRGPGRGALVFQADSPAGVDQLYAELTEAGYQGHLAPFDGFWGQRYAIVLDPDGSRVEIYASL